jgi:hypothetical protein
VAFGAVATLCAAAAGAVSVAQEPEAQPGPSSPAPQPSYSIAIAPYDNVARLNVGLGLFNSGWYNCNYFYPYYACSTGSYTSYVPFVLGLQVDLHIGNASYLSPGFQAMTGSTSASYFNGTTTIENSTHVTLWEPSLDYVGKIGPLTKEIVGRFRVGGGVYVGSDGHTGGAFRIGGGGSFFNNRRLGLGLDFVFEGGSYDGYWISGVQLLVSPELHF